MFFSFCEGGSSVKIVQYQCAVIRAAKRQLELFAPTRSRSELCSQSAPAI